ncbi:MAG: hypothetical protein WEC83_01420 [Patescibacteria group bacterium]
MTQIELINYLSIVVLVGFIIALGYLIVLLHRANRIVAKLDNLQQTFTSFVSEIVPAIVNIGTISSAMHGILRALHIDREDTKPKSKK